VEQERGDQVGEAVGMGEGDDSQMGLVRMQTHGADDVIGVGGELIWVKGDEAGPAGGAGGELEMGDAGWRRWEFGNGLAGFQRADRHTGFPGTENLDQEWDPVTVGEGDGIGERSGVGGPGETVERPGRATGVVGHGQGIRGSIQDLTPTLIQMDHLRSGGRSGPCGAECARDDPRMRPAILRAWKRSNFMAEANGAGLEYKPGRNLRPGGSVFNHEADLEGDLPDEDLGLVDAPAGFHHLEPAEVLEGFAGALDGVGNGVLDGGLGGAGQFDEFIDGIFHGDGILRRMRRGFNGGFSRNGRIRTLPPTPEGLNQLNPADKWPS
jgi:hypothetical protein